MTKTDLTREDIEHMAQLANLQLNEKETDAFQSQLTETLSYVENMRELDTKNVVPTNHTTNSKNVMFRDGIKGTRTFTSAQALQNAPQKKINLFYVERLTAQVDQS